MQSTHRLSSAWALGLAFLVVLLPILIGCGKVGDLTGSDDPKVVAALARINAAIAEKSVERVLQNAVPELGTEDNIKALRNVLAVLPDSAVLSQDRASFQRSLLTTNNATTETLAVHYQYRYPDAWRRVSMTLKSEAGDYKLVALEISQLPGDQRVSNAFRWTDRPIAQQAFLVGMVAVPLLILLTLIDVVRSRKKIRRPWLWFVFVLFGFLSVTLNWSTGEFAIEPLSVSLLGSGATRASEFAPWIFKLSIPVGAIAYWIARLGKKRQQQPT